MKEENIEMTKAKIEVFIKMKESLKELYGYLKQKSSTDKDAEELSNKILEAIGNE